MSLRKRYSFVKSFSPELMYGSPGKYRKLSEDELYEEWLRQHSNILTPSPEQEKEAPEFTKIYLNGPKLSSEKGLNLSAESFDSSNGNEEETSNDGENKRGNEIANESWFNSLEESNVDGVFSAPKSNYPQTNSLTRTTSEANENRHGQIENKGEIENFEIVASKQEFTCNKPVLSRGSSSGGSSCSGSEKYNRKNAVECDPPDVDTENSDEEMGKPHSKGKYSFREAETAFGVESSLPRSTENLQHYVIRSNSSQNGEVIVEDSAVQFGWKRSEFGPNYEQIIVAENPVEMQVSTANYHQEATPSGMEDLKVAYYGPVYLYPRDGPDSSTPRTVRALSVSSTSSSTADGAITGYHLDSTVSDNEKDREHRSSVEFGLSKWDNADFEVREEMSFQEETPQMTPRSGK